MQPANNIAWVWLFFVCVCGLQWPVSAEDVPKYNRRVLILDFVNQQKSANVDYLSVTIAEALIDPLKKTGKFEILPRSAGGTFNEAEAIAKGLEAKADVVVVGNFVAIQNVLQIQAKAIDVGEKRLALSKARTTRLNATLFDNINALADDMTKEMAEKLPPLAQRVIVHETDGDFIARFPVLHVYGGGALLWGNESKYVMPGLGGSADFSFQFLHRFLQPYFSVGGFLANGKERISKMNFLGIDGGLSGRIRLGKPFVITPIIGGGFQMGTINAAFEIKYLVPTFFGGLLADCFFTEKFGISLAVKQHILLESDTPLKILSIQVGAGYRI